ncbi:hypothetical protein [Micromonospora sp. WMMD975]|uniref:hypothetical protein n=1 Tax=Micromonospora sp. WMMD975 TaxID=3016087 RepID=UPI00249A6E62|nr:hypothetical protein [Micromonospora sp. WMMD975]WFE30929.1 hypothetical protein O7613_14825 [Micromonospora sp. WMMD975]
MTSLAIFLAMIVLAAVLMRTVDRGGTDDEPPDLGLEPTGADSGLVTVSAAVGTRCRIVPLAAGRNRTRATAKSLRERPRPAGRRTAPGLAVHHQETAGPPQHVLRPLARPNHAGETIRASGPRRRSRPLIIGTAVVLLAAVTAAALPAAAARPTADRDFCPRRTSVTISDRGQTLDAWLRRDTSGLFLHLCWRGAGGDDEVVRWAATAHDTTTDRPTGVAVVPLTSRTALGNASLAAGRSWTLRFEVSTRSGGRSLMATTVRT